MSISSLLSQLVDIFKNWSHDTPEPYVLPAATADTLGGVKVGTGLSVNANGMLSTSDDVVNVIFTAHPNMDTPETTYEFDSVSMTVEEIVAAKEAGKSLMGVLYMSLSIPEYQMENSAWYSGGVFVGKTGDTTNISATFLSFNIFQTAAIGPHVGFEKYDVEYTNGNWTITPERADVAMLDNE